VFQNKGEPKQLESITILIYASHNACGCAGVLVLSEFAGAAQSLGAGAILVNPWNITDMAAAIEDALTMSDQASFVPHWTTSPPISGFLCAWMKHVASLLGRVSWGPEKLWHPLCLEA
jgi:hypothetical protein